VVEAELVEDETSLAPIDTVRSESLFLLAVGKLSENTRKAYAQDIARFGEWWGEPQPLAALVKFSAGAAREVVLRYQAWMVRRKLSKNTVARAIRSLNSIIKKLAFAEKVPWTLDVPVGKVQVYKDVRGPGQEQWDKLIAHTTYDTRWFGTRDVAMFRLLGNDGFRASEVGKILHPDHLRESEEHGPEIFVQGKGDKDVWQPIHPKTWMAINDWLVKRQVHLGDDRHGPLFFSERGNMISGNRVWDRVVVRAREAGLKHIHPHQLRHHAITVRAKKWNGPQIALTRWARHADPRTTQVYVDDVGEEMRDIANLGDEDE
jgi:site-specific recombinase XerD